MDFNSLWNVALPADIKTRDDREGIFPSHGCATVRRGEKCVSRISDLKNSALRRVPLRLRVTPQNPPNKSSLFRSELDKLRKEGCPALYVL